MKCPKCGSDTSVIDSRHSERFNTTRRRRICNYCKYRYSTYEATAEQMLGFEKLKGVREEIFKLISRRIKPDAEQAASVQKEHTRKKKPKKKRSVPAPTSW